MSLQNKETINLKKCPFCGFNNPDYLKIESYREIKPPFWYEARVACYVCVCYGPAVREPDEGEAKSKAVNLWNEREDNR